MAEVLLFVKIIFFVLKYTIGLMLDGLVADITFTALQILFVVKLSDVALLLVDIFLIRRFFSFR